MARDKNERKLRPRLCSQKNNGKKMCFMSYCLSYYGVCVVSCFNQLTIHIYISTENIHNMNQNMLLLITIDSRSFYAYSCRCSNYSTSYFYYRACSYSYLLSLFFIIFYDIHFLILFVFSSAFSPFPLCSTSSCLAFSFIILSHAYQF
jgi:hypothetical protein